MPRHLLHRSLKGVRGLATAEFAGGFDEAGELLTLWSGWAVVLSSFMAVRRAVWISGCSGEIILSLYFPARR